MGHPPSYSLTALRDHWNVADAFGAEDAAVAFDFGGSAERFGVVIGELYGRLAFDSRDFADQADGVEVAAAGGIAAAKIIGE